jgi:hypothetical protein
MAPSPTAASSATPSASASRTPTPSVTASPSASPTATADSTPNTGGLGSIATATPRSSGSQSVKIFIFDSGGRLVWSSGPTLGDNGSGISFSSQPFYAGGLTSSDLIQVGTATFDWNGLASDGSLVGTGDYLVKAEVTTAGSTATLSKVLTVIVQLQHVLASVSVFPNPAKDFMAIDLSQAPQGIGVELEVWNLGGELVRTFEATTGPGQRLTWDLSTSTGQMLSDGIYVMLIRSTSGDSRLQDKKYVKFVLNRR